MWRIRFPQIVFCFSSAVFYSISALSQTVPDSSLETESSTIKRTTLNNDSVDLIEGGAARDSNLFHSFSEFNVDTGNAVYFANPDGVNNILTRVTGNNISNIFGTLGVDGAADLWLLNPNGIVFGENAALDVNGSFFATTAESFVFDEAEFSAVKPATAPLLKVNLTPGLQMSSNSGSITVQGKGHSLVGGIFSPLYYSDTPTGLQVKAGEAIALIGSNIDLRGGIIRTPGADVWLSSVAEGSVKLTNTQTWQIDISGAQRLGNIELSDRALVDTGGIATGDIHFQGNNIVLKDASAAIIQNLRDRASGKITADAEGLVELSGAVRNAPETPTSTGVITGIAYSRLTTETLGSGIAGDIVINAQGLSLDEGGHIASRTFSNAGTGEIDIDVSNAVEVKSYSPLSPSFFSSVISTATFGLGGAGKTNVSAKNIQLLDGGAISSINFGSGGNKAGEIQIDVTEDLIMDGITPQTLSPSIIASSTFRTGDSGSVTINTARLLISNGGTISTSTLAEGSAGQLTINATEYIKVTNPDVEDPKFALSNSGIVSDGAILALDSRQLINVPNVPSGNSGNLFLNTPTLIISNGAEIGVGNQGLGNSGNLRINAERVFLDDEAKISALSATGQGGNIELNLKDSLLLSDRSSITAENTGSFMDSQADVNGGNIAIDADTVALLKESQINANAFEGDGGNINLTTQGLFVSNDSLVTASSEFGLDGNIEIEQINTERYIEFKKLSENLAHADQKITRTCSAKDSKFAIVGKGGLPENPGQSLRGQALWQDLRLPTIKSNSTAERSLSQQSQPVLREANSWQITPQGRVQLLARYSSASQWDRDLDCAKLTTK